MESPNQHIDLISKHLSKQTNAEEERLLFEWVEKDNQNQIQFDEFKKAWEISEIHFDPEIDAIDIDKEWVKMKLEIAQPKNIDIGRPPKKVQLNWMQIAASVTILILIGSGLIYVFSPSETILASSNIISENKLPDGSIITLNQHSEISFNDDFNKEYREVKLLGEAYFKVQPDKSKPFIVRTGLLSVEVVGTSFYIKNLANSADIEVIVESGTVKLYDQNKNMESILLNAGESATFNSSSSKISKLVSPDINSISWKTKIFNFENATLEQIIQTLNICYHSNIVIKNTKLSHCSLTVSFNNQSIESILKVLEATIDIQVEKKDNAIEINGNGCGNENNQ